MRRVSTLLLVVWLAAKAAPAAAAAGAHVHGQGVLDVSIDEGLVELFLVAPLADLKTEAIDGPEAMIQRQDLFEFEGASCRFVSGSQETAPVFEDTWGESEPQEAAHEHEHEHEHEDKSSHAHEEGHTHADTEAHAHAHEEGHAAHAHEEEAHEHEGDHGHDHDHDDHDGGSHSDSYLTWIYECDGNPAALRVKLFEDTHLERLAVQAASGSGVNSAELTSSDNNFELP